ncbi:methionine synthase [Commensalibacter oyaizuii]|uniref:Methionine synthase n=1 Tax=Commensalibacter oyaizuii TaxID=3043873 RepID=A0ABT6Q3S3_9PROT|nr:methionine synthase [Commensalibacter sp. TBRC 16381]MDI2091768.1 methionine synthase [Commensalibacter sp. TBRC 16381]
MSGQSKLLNKLQHHILLCDGGMGSIVQMLDLDIDKDFWGKENCTEVLNLSRPDLVRDIHRQYFAAGADIVETNSFGGSITTLSEFDLQDQTREINKRAAEIANEAAESFADNKERFVVGSIGPGTRLPSLGNIAYDPLENAITEQCRGLIDGGVHGFLIETCQDPLQIKAAVNAAKIAQKEANIFLPIFVQVTIETTGTLLVGSDIAAAATVIDALDVQMMGMNCGTGPREMAEAIKWLSQYWPKLISMQPNAGLPELVDGKTHYPLSPEEMGHWMSRYIEEQKINMIGGCCGTNPNHIAAMHKILCERAQNEGTTSDRPKIIERTHHWVPSVASLFTSTPLRQENSLFSIGERCNANGSKKWRDLQAEQDWDGCVTVGREQLKEGSNALDVCMAFVGRDEDAEMREIIPRFTSSINAPLVIDSTGTDVIESCLKLHGGKPIINSINFEDGEEIAAERMVLARKFGASVIALTIDEVGMAKTPEDKLRITQRLVDFACNRYGLPQSDLMIDPLTFTIATGVEDDRKLGLWTLEGIKAIRDAFPDIQIVLGLSNISFGLNPAARAVLNSVFLHHAQKMGMTAAIVHVSKIRPLHLIDEAEIKVMEDLIFDRREGDYDPLKKVLEIFADRKASQAATRPIASTIEEQLHDRIVDGNRKGLEDDLKRAMETYPPLEIINNLLLNGMKTVGELFGSGKMQLPFVLQSAETMKAAVSFLEPFMEKTNEDTKGTMVLATVKGDVHDIGKNLVDIILSNNGFRVVNLGIKVPVADMINAAKEHRADAIGMSGLLVKSTVIMKDNLLEMAEQGLNIPVLLGGAALTRAYVDEDCAEVYKKNNGLVAYARDAFDGLTLMEKIASGQLDDYVAAQKVQNKRPKRNNKKETITAIPISAEEATKRRQDMAPKEDVPTPPFWGVRKLEAKMKAILPFLNERSLYQLQWGMKKQGKTLEEFLENAKTSLRPILHKLMDECEKENILQPQALYGYWKAAAEGEDLILFDEDGQTELCRFTLPRQHGANRFCITDFVRDIQDPVRDVIGLQVVTVGQQASDTARVWFEENRYQDYLYLHGLSVEMTEAMAEYTHQRMRSELGYISEDDPDMNKLLMQGYRGSRYSFGYPACPNLEDQKYILELLKADQLGITLSDEWQLHPEQSTSALVIFHPKAKYFII